MFVASFVYNAKDATYWTIVQQTTKKENTKHLLGLIILLLFVSIFSYQSIRLGYVQVP